MKSHEKTPFSYGFPLVPPGTSMTCVIQPSPSGRFGEAANDLLRGVLEGGQF